MAIGPGYAGVPLLFGGERPKSSESFCPGENEARRPVGELGVGGGEFSLVAMIVVDEIKVVKQSNKASISLIEDEE